MSESTTEVQEPKAKAKRGGTGTGFTDVSILQVNKGVAECFIVGTSPYICNRMSQKTFHELLLPAGKRNAAERASVLKHDPRAEYRASPYTLPTGPTLIGCLTGSFKKAMMTAALDLPGTNKTQIGRLIRVEGQYTHLYGMPKVLMAAVRSADMKRTPDIRTRAILPEWACRLTVSFMKPMLQKESVGRLLGAAGMYVGVGDWRQEKGSGDFGLFEVVDPEHELWPVYERLTEQEGRAAQQVGLETPVAYDAETDDLLAWYDAELASRQRRGVGPKGKKADEAAAVA